MALFNREKENFKTFTHDALNRKSLSNNSVFSFLQDESKTLWIGTFGGGISLLDKRKQRFKHISEKSSATPLNSPIVTAINKDNNGALWIGTYGGGVNVIDEKTGEIFYLKNDPANPFSGKIKFVNTIAFDKSGKVWIGTDSEGAFVFDPRTDKYLQYKKTGKDGNGIQNNFVKKIYQTSSGDIWLTTLNGLALFNQDENNLDHLQINQLEIMMVFYQCQQNSYTLKIVLVLEFL